MLELIEKKTKNAFQIITTSHSPEILTFADETASRNASVVCRLKGSHEEIIRLISDLPNAAELREFQGLGRLLSSGWMENALAFTEGDDEETTG